MGDSWTFGRKLALGFAVTVLAFVAVTVTGLRSTRTLVDDAAWVTHTREVRTRLARLLSVLIEAETAGRGFALTGTERFLAAYRLAAANLDAGYEGARRLTSDSADQQDRFTAIRPLLDARMAELRAVIDARRTTGLEAAVARVASERGQELTDRIRRSITQMDDHEEALLEVRTRDARAATEMASDVAMWGGAATVLFTIAIGWVLSRSLARRVGTAVHQVESASAELQTAANQQVSGMREQATAMTEIATTMTELRATSRQISESAARVSEIARQTAAAARVGEATVVEGHEATARVRRQIDLVVAHMLELGTKSAHAGTVLDIVTELAEQTNILAINAAIEAAGAGDAGRRFGVVADEIRKLADRVTSSTQGIRVVLDDVRGAVTTAVMATETGSKAVDVGASQVAEMARAFREIAAQVATTTEAAREIELSTKQQAAAVDQVNIAITDAAQATRETETSATQTLQTASQLTLLSSALTRLVQRRS